MIRHLKFVRILIIIIILLFAGLIMFGQPQTKLHAYKQANIPGARPVVVDEQGNRKPIAIRYNYWFYFEMPKSSSIIVSEVWVEGKRYKVKGNWAASTPVTKIIHTGNANPDTVLLVPKTVGKVVLLVPTDTLQMVSKPSKSLETLIKNSELVIGYYWKRKKYFKSVKTIVNLPPEAHQ